MHGPNHSQSCHSHIGHRTDRGRVMLQVRGFHHQVRELDKILVEGLALMACSLGSLTVRLRLLQLHPSMGSRARYALEGNLGSLNVHGLKSLP